MSVKRTFGTDGLLLRMGGREESEIVQRTEAGTAQQNEEEQKPEERRGFATSHG
jgi:hypothetical protein